ncbi:hypothetical protein D9611_003622 [Ephemerocybe angulata]|uniref:F-box domain-containing protein n=1 Tax=Ephemerocybe angulata TaxID=980116 RepID=A0A8H5EYF3_9AGAR|nr:hypothetical protein D9611_003622 [Tulosesus angulatus]
MKTAYQANEGILPPELNDEIAAFCSGESLCHLALANKEFQAHAEKLLYARVAVRTYHEWEIGAFETLATNATKAGYVKFLSLEFYREKRPTDSAIVEKLLTAGPALTNLRDFRIRLRKDLRNHVGDLDGMLSAGHFHLNTLFADNYFDFNMILEGQNDLTVIGIFQVSNGDAPSSLLKSVEGRSLLTVGLTRETYLPVYNNIDMVPELLSLEQAQKFDVILGQAFEDDAMLAVSTNAESVSCAFVYLQNVPSKEIFEAFIAAASRIFVSLCELTMRLGCIGDTLEEWRKAPVSWPKTISKLGIWDWSSGDLRSSKLKFTGSPDEFAKSIHKLL